MRINITIIFTTLFINAICAQPFSIEEYRSKCKTGFSKEVLLRNLEIINNDIENLAFSKDLILKNDLIYLNFWGNVLNLNDQSIGRVHDYWPIRKLNRVFVAKLSSFDNSKRYIDKAIGYDLNVQKSAIRSSIAIPWGMLIGWGLGYSKNDAIGYIGIGIFVFSPLYGFYNSVKTIYFDHMSEKNIKKAIFEYNGAVLNKRINGN